MKIIRDKDRYRFNTDWLRTIWHFSFDHYYDPANKGFGTLRVFNEDTITPATGFPPHSHRDMEIITVVLQGELEHKDSVGNQGVIRPGEVQVMSAGKGITHSEFNHSQTEALHLMQIWILPDKRDHEPRYDQRTYSLEARQGKLLPVVSGQGIPETLWIHQEATIYLSTLNEGQSVRHASGVGRKTYVFVPSGSVLLNGKESLQIGDQVRMQEAGELTIEAKRPTELVLIDLP
jgi:redox-sensitive bicupin YhaK (pirin superfamily)